MVDVPVLLFHGGLDRNAPLPQAQWLAAHMPDADLTIWPELGHISTLDRLDEVVARLTKGLS
jgi:pimeloyl-ACP methyl ester carboxylesterase